MINVGVGFLYCVWTFYSFYRFIVLKSNFYEEMIAINSIWLFYHNAFTIIILISANMIKTEGLKTCRTAHAIINCCNDADIATSVRAVYTFSIFLTVILIWFLFSRKSYPNCLNKYNNIIPLQHVVYFHSTGLYYSL